MGDFSPCVQAPPDPSHRNPWLGPGHQTIFRISGWLPWWRGLRGAILDILGQGLPQMLAPLVHRTKDRILRERKGTGFQRPQITAISASLKTFATLSKHFFFFGQTVHMACRISVSWPRIWPRPRQRWWQIPSTRPAGNSWAGCSCCPHFTDASRGSREPEFLA